MRPDRSPARWSGLLLLSLPWVLSADAGIESGKRRFCVPNADRSGWECSEVDSPPATGPSVDPAPAADAPESSPPPSMLAAPPEQDAAPLSDFYRVVPDTEPDPAPLPETVLSEPQAIAAEPESEPAPQPEPAVTAVPEAVAEPDPEPVVVAEPVAAEPVPSEPEPVPAFLAAPEVPEPMPAEAALPEPAPVVSAPEPEPAPAAPAPVAAPEPVAEPVVAAPAVPAAVAPVPPPVAGRTRLAMLGGARDFARLDGNAYTLQLADAATPDGFPGLVDRLGLSPTQVYLLRVKRDGSSWWLLAHGQFTDANQAKAALARLPSVPGLARNWPRKIQYLQREFDPLGP